MNRRPVVTPNSPLASSKSLSAAAVATYAPAALLRGGPVQRAANLVVAGHAVEVAAATAARQGKGHVGEVQQAAGYSTRAGVLGRSYQARPNRKATDPNVDVELRRRRSGRRAAGAQIKVGSARYVLRAARSGRYQMLVVNTEAREVIAENYGLELSDALDFRGNASVRLSAEECEEQATESIVRMLTDELPFGFADNLTLCARAGFGAGVESLATGLLFDLVQAVWSGRSFDFGASVRGAASSAVRNAGRAGVQAHLLIRKFLAKARRQFSDRLLHRIAGSAVVLGAVAEVVVETAIDLLRVMRNEMTFEELLRSFGVHVCTAAGGALGMAIAGALTGGAVWWVQALAMVVGGGVGARYGRQVGTNIFDAPALPPAPQPQGT
jgi:hypothetical protein